MKSIVGHLCLLGIKRIHRPYNQNAFISFHLHIRFRNHNPTHLTTELSKLLASGTTSNMNLIQ